MLGKKVEDIMNHMKWRIVGQKEALEELRTVLVVMAAGVSDPQKPLCILHFAGPTGVGKSEVVVALAEAIHGTGDMVCRVHCNQLQESHSISSIVGAPPGYVGYTEQATVIDSRKVQGKMGYPGILVFEEFEKAHPDVKQGLLGMFDKGSLRMNTGTMNISLTNTIIILTSNIGARKLSEEATAHRIGFSGNTVPDKKDITDSAHDRIKSIVKKEMEHILSPELIGRIDKTVVFRWLTDGEAMQIVNRIAFNFGERLGRLYDSLYIEPEVIQYVANKGYNRVYGARPLRQEFRKSVELPVAEKMALEGASGMDFFVTIENGAILIRAEQNQDLLKSAEEHKTGVVEKAAVPVGSKASQKVLKSPGDDTQLEVRIVSILGRKIELKMPRSTSLVFDAWSNVFSYPEVEKKLGDLDEKHLSSMFRLIANMVKYSDVRLENLSRINDSVKIQILYKSVRAIVDDSYRGKFTKETMNQLRTYNRP
jgi:ATP-dependent Clp protease ATP-binding subunit ClpC